MTPWFATSERLAALEAEAQSWAGTPWWPNGRSKGPKGGVSCQMLAYEILLALGAITPFELPRASMRIGDQLKLTRLGSILAERPEFHELDEGAETLPGDLISFRVTSGEWHLGLRLPDTEQTLRFIQSLPPFGVSFSNLADGTYNARLLRGWRIIEL